MSHSVTISDDRYEHLAALASQRGQTPEEYISSLVDDAWERRCTGYDAAFAGDPTWLAGAQDALREVASGQAASFSSTEAFFRQLGASDEEIEAARQVDLDGAGQG
jgi:hypothetical protein